MRPFLSALVLALLVPQAITAAGATTQPTDPNGDGLRYVGSTTFRPDPEQGVILVTAELVVTNVKPDEPTTNGRIRYLFPGVALPVLDLARNIRARSGGAPLDVTISAAEGATDTAEVDFPTDLAFGDERSISVDYEVPSAPARSLENVTRVNPAYVAFPVVAIGDPGLASVRVELPENFEPDIVGSDPDFGADGASSLTATSISEPTSWWAIVTGQDDARLLDEIVEQEDRTWHVRSWPGDDEWSMFVTDYLGAPLEEMQRLIGEPWPDDRPYDVVEAYNPYLYGYAGWFEPLERRIVIGENLDPTVVMHELAHGWFNGSAISERWLNEGLANAFAELTLTAIGVDAAQPEPIPDTPMFPLASWADAFAEADEETAALAEAYGYAASWSIVDQVIAEIGVEQTQLVLDAVFGRRPAFGGTDPETLTDAAVDNRRFLDLVERVGGSEAAAGLMELYVLSETDLEQLPGRSAALERYDDLAERGDTWAVPLGIRRAMEGWGFDKATRAIDDATAVLDLRDRLRVDVDRIGLAFPAGLESSYEKARLPLEDVSNQISSWSQTATKLAHVTDHAAEERSLVERIGLWGTDVDQILDVSSAAFEAGDPELVDTGVDRVEAALDGADTVGWQRIGLVAVALLIVVILAIIALRPRGR